MCRLCVRFVTAQLREGGYKSERTLISTALACRERALDEAKGDACKQVHKEEAFRFMVWVGGEGGATLNLTQPQHSQPASSSPLTPHPRFFGSNRESLESWENSEILKFIIRRFGCVRLLRRNGSPKNVYR